MLEDKTKEFLSRLLGADVDIQYLGAKPHFDVKKQDSQFSYFPSEEAELTWLERMSEVNHPNIIKVYIQSILLPSECLSSLSSFTALVCCEHIPRRSLKTLLNSKVLLKCHHIKQITSQVALALEYLHRKHHMSHRSLNLEAVLVRNHDENNINIVLDLMTKARKELSYIGEGANEDKFLAPELRKSFPKIHTEAADVFSLGVLLEEICRTTYWDSELNILINQMKDENPQNRPTFKQVAFQTLKGQVVSARNDVQIKPANSCLSFMKDQKIRVDGFLNELVAVCTTEDLQTGFVLLPNLTIFEP